MRNCKDSKGFYRSSCEILLTKESRSEIRNTISDIKGNLQRKFLLGKIFLLLYAEGIYITLKEKDGSVNLCRWGSQRSLKKN
jgi:hypothetical protein